MRLKIKDIKTLSQELQIQTLSGQEREVYNIICSNPDGITAFEISKLIDRSDKLAQNILWRLRTRTNLIYRKRQGEYYNPYKYFKNEVKNEVKNE